MYQTQILKEPLLKAIKRNGALVDFNAEKITLAITNAFLSLEENKHNVAAVQSKAEELTENIVVLLHNRYTHLGAVSIEEIQDQVELALMRTGEHKAARNYILYREEHAKQRVHNHPIVESIRLVDGQGNSTPLNATWLAQRTQRATKGLAHTNANDVLKETHKNLFDGIDYDSLDEALIMASRVFIEQEYNYSFVTARLLLDKIARTSLRFFDIAQHANHSQLAQFYKQAFNAAIQFGVQQQYYNDTLASKFDLEALGKAICPENDLLFGYLGLRTVYDRYLMHHEKTRFELPQVFFMRVAMGLAINEDKPTERAIEYYTLLSRFDFMSSTPTLFNAGCVHSQLSSCYLTTVSDDLDGIYEAIKENALLSKWAGGLGNDWTPVRALGSAIKGTNGESQGVVPFLKVANDTAVAVNQGGKRKGAVCAYLETWHMDIEEFLELRKNTGDERRRTHDMNTANWIPDLFMQRVFKEEMWTLFSPSDTPDLHDLHGDAFAKQYAIYEQLAQAGTIRAKQVPALDLWRKMISMLFETGHPWITFKDACNIRSPQSHVGCVHSSNLCTEITLNTSDTEIAVCNLGSVNLAQHVTEKGIDTDKLRNTVRTAVRMLDNVIDINYYAVEKARNSNFKHRPIGLGLMGFHDALYKQKISYASAAALDFADSSMEQISYYALEASSDLAVERGCYESYKGSFWSQGILPLDSFKLLAETRGEDFFAADMSAQLDWHSLRQKIAKQGMRNSNVLAIAPTATIANITGVSQSIEPTYQNLYVKSNLSGEFTVINPYLVEALREQGLWDNAMRADLKTHDGSIAGINRVPEDLKQRFAIAFEIEPKWLIEAASRRQKWIDQAQSLNLYIASPNGKMLDTMYKMAWIRGLKTTYYLRSIGATSTEKSTVTDSKLNSVAVHTNQAPVADAAAAKMCLTDDPDCEACQ